MQQDLQASRSILRAVLTVAIAAAFFPGVAFSQSGPTGASGQSLIKEGVVLSAFLPKGMEAETLTRSASVYSAKIHKWEGRVDGCCKVIAVIASLQVAGGGEAVFNVLPETVRSKILSYAVNYRMDALNGEVVRRGQFSRDGYSGRRGVFRVEGSTRNIPNRSIRDRLIKTRLLFSGSKVAGVEVYMPQERSFHQYPRKLFRSFSIKDISQER